MIASSSGWGKGWGSAGSDVVVAPHHRVSWPGSYVRHSSPCRGCAGWCVESSAPSWKWGKARTFPKAGCRASRGFVFEASSWGTSMGEEFEPELHDYLTGSWLRGAWAFFVLWAVLSLV